MRKLKRIIRKINKIQVGDTYKQVIQKIGMPDSSFSKLKESRGMLKYTFGLDYVVITIYILNNIVITIDKANLNKLERQINK